MNKYSAPLIGVAVAGLLALAMPAAPHARADGSYTVNDGACGISNDYVSVSGTYSVGDYNGSWKVYDEAWLLDDQGHPTISTKVFIAEGTFDNTPCPPPPVYDTSPIPAQPQAPAEPPAQAAPAPVQQGSSPVASGSGASSSSARTTTVEGQPALTDASVAPATETPSAAPSASVSAEETVEEASVTASPLTRQEVNALPLYVGLASGGVALLLAAGLGGAAVYRRMVAKRA